MLKSPKDDFYRIGTSNASDFLTKEVFVLQVFGSASKTHSI